MQAFGVPYAIADWVCESESQFVKLKAVNSLSAGMDRPLRIGFPGTVCHVTCRRSEQTESNGIADSHWGFEGVERVGVILVWFTVRSVCRGGA